MGKYSIPSPEPGWRPAVLCFPGAPSQRAYLCHAALPFPRSTARLREHKSVRVRLMDLSPRTILILGVNQGSVIQTYLPSTDKKAYTSCRLHSAHGHSCEVTTSPLLTSTEQFKAKGQREIPKQTYLTRCSQNLHFARTDFIAL